MAWERHAKLGAEVGYQIRFDDQTSLGTRICFVTEGILLRWLQDDPTLADTAAVLFDEFHERNLLSDVALALAKQLQRTTRPDLKIAVMSATLDAERVAAYLDDCPVLISEGQSFPVEVEHLDQHDERPLTDQAADRVERIVNSGLDGDILVFMPGVGEIAMGRFAPRAPTKGWRSFRYGELQPSQDAAFASNHASRGCRGVAGVVTIEVFATWWQWRRARGATMPSAASATLFLTRPISRASADRQGGGRHGTGCCWRLWTEAAA